MPDPRILTWDWRGQPNLAELARVLTDVSNGTVHLTEVDTGDDQYAIVLSPQPVNKPDAYAMYRRDLMGETL
jgi:hypothetical protein